MRKTITYLLAMTIACNLSAQNTTSAKIKDLISKMTLEEKVNMVVGTGFSMPGSNATEGPNIGMTKDKVAGASGTTFAIPRLGIPAMVVSDGPAGVRIDPIRNGDSSKTYYATAWPVAILLASSWEQRW